MISVVIQDQQVLAAFRRLLENSRDPTPANAGIAARMLAAVEDNFRAEGRPEPWKPLHHSTIAARVKAGRAGKILQRTSHMARSILPFHSQNMAGVGTNVPYAVFMNNGTRAHIIKARKRRALLIGDRFFKKVNHPGTVPRPFMMLTDQDKADMLEIMARHIASGL